MNTKKSKRDPNRYPSGWNRSRVEAVIRHYDNQTPDEAIAEAEAAYRNREATLMVIPTQLVAKVRGLIAKHHQSPKSAARPVKKTRRAA